MGYACVRAIAHRKKREGCTESEREKEREKGGKEKREVWSIQKTEVERHTIGVN